MSGPAPILLTSPTIRSGTTLLQRLLCSSSNALVYGEEIGKDLEILLQIFTARKMVYGHSRHRFASSLGQVMAGDSNQWLVDLMPDIDAYLAALSDGCFAGLASCGQQAQQAGRPLWGFKYPGWPPHMIRQLVASLPDTRVIYIHRGLADTARSAKAWGAVEGEHGMQAFCAQWLGHLQFIRQWQREHEVLVLEYEALVAEPGDAIARLCGFLPFEGMDRDLLQVRINNAGRAGAAPGSPHAYLEPAPLTAREQAWVDAATAQAAA